MKMETTTEAMQSLFDSELGRREIEERWNALERSQRGDETYLALVYETDPSRMHEARTSTGATSEAEVRQDRGCEQSSSTR